MPAQYNIDDQYKSDEYLNKNPSWHVEDSEWKARQIHRVLTANSVNPSRICEIGCGVGQILQELQNKISNPGVEYYGYDIAPKAIGQARKLENEHLHFFSGNLLDESNEDTFDLLLAIDVFEHVPNYLGFLEQCRTKATWKIYHIPLDVHVSSVLRNQLTQGRYTVGHLHYFNAASAIASLQDTGHEIIDWTYTAGAIELYRTHPSLKRALANLPRWLLSRLSTGLSARLLGGYSLLVLAK